MQNFSAKEKYFLYNTLNSVPYLLHGYSVLIDLRNETSVAGRIDNCDGFMNVELVDAVFIDRNGLQYAFEQFMVRERMIRQIHIPADVNMEQKLRDWFEHGVNNKKRIGKTLLDRKKGKRTYKQKRAEERHKEILQEIQQAKQKNNDNDDKAKII